MKKNKRPSNIRMGYASKNIVNRFFHDYKSTFFLGLFCWLVGVMLAIIIVAYYKKEIEKQNFFDNNIILILTRERSVITSFLIYSFIFSILFSIIVFINSKPWNVVFSIIILVVIGYWFSYNISVVIIVFGFPGFINAIIILVPSYLILSLLFIIVFAIVFKRNLIINKFGCNYFDTCFLIDYKRFLIWAYVLILVSTLIYCLLLPLMRITIIINS